MHEYYVHITRFMHEYNCKNTHFPPNKRSFIIKKSLWNTHFQWFDGLQVAKQREYSTLDKLPHLQIHQIIDAFRSHLLQFTEEEQEENQSYDSKHLVDLSAEE